MKKVLILGGATLDFIVHLDQFPTPTPQTIHKCDFYEAVGSTGVGKAANLCRLEFETTLHAMIGADVYGDIIRAYLKKLPLTFLESIDPNGTERHVNLMNANGERISIFITQTSTDPDLNYNDFQPYIAAADFIILNIIDYCRNFIPLLKAENKVIWTDLHDFDGTSMYHQDFIHASDYVFLSSDNLADYQATMVEIMKLGKKLVVCTHGKLGASLLTPDFEWIHSPIWPGFELVDSNGAGDAFFSGFMYGFYNAFPLEQCLKFGHIAGGLCVSCNQIAYPELSTDNLRSFLK